MAYYGNHNAAEDRQRQMEERRTRSTPRSLAEIENQVKRHDAEMQLTKIRDEISKTERLSNKRDASQRAVVQYRINQLRAAENEFQQRLIQYTDTKTTQQEPGLAGRRTG